jgi:hypothetical protein
MSRKTLAAAMAACLALGACALVREQPTAQDCARLASELSVANNALVLARAALDTASSAGASAPVVERISRDVGIAQGAVDSLSVLQRQKCAAV